MNPTFSFAPAALGAIAVDWTTVAAATAMIVQFTKAFTIEKLVPLSSPSHDDAVRGYTLLVAIIISLLVGFANSNIATAHDFVIVLLEVVAFAATGAGGAMFGYSALNGFQHQTPPVSRHSAAKIVTTVSGAPVQRPTETRPPQ